MFTGLNQRVSTVDVDLAEVVAGRIENWVDGGAWDAATPQLDGARRGAAIVRLIAIITL